MAVQHKKADGTETTNGDLPVVKPMNMGKGLLWDPATKTYYVAIDERAFEIDELGRLNLRVSALEDNQLSIRDDGVYQGTAAKPELKTLHVDAVNGIDQNPLEVKGAGTREMPLRTLQYALSLGETGTTRFIHLHEKQDHLCSATTNVDVKSGNCTIAPYGPETDAFMAVEPTTTSVRYRLVQEGKEPKIVFTGVRTWKNANNTDSGFLLSSIVLVNTNVIIDGVSIVNDLSYRLDPTGISSVSFKQPFRMGGSGSVYTTRGRLLTRGRTINNISGLSVERDGVNQVGLFYGSNLNINLYNTVNDIATDLDCYVIPAHGWSSVLDNTTSLNAGGNSEDNKRAIAKRVYGVKKQTVGSGFVVTAPSTIIDHTYFT